MIDLVAFYKSQYLNSQKYIASEIERRKFPSDIKITKTSHIALNDIFIRRAIWEIEQADFSWMFSGIREIEIVADPVPGMENEAGLAIGPTKFQLTDMFPTPQVRLSGFMVHEATHCLCMRRGFTVSESLAYFMQQMYHDKLAVVLGGVPLDVCADNPTAREYLGG